ncbi:MAG: LptF/LptG family permease, partial [Verrucomicrobiota bacterium]
IMDLTDNGRDFISAGAGFGLLGKYYLVQLPQMVMLVLPITLLLSLLFALGRMSRANEIISMLGSGLSLTRVLRPLLIAGGYATLICLVLNYEWAPNADARKEGILAQVSDMAADKKKTSSSSGRDEEWIAQGWLYRNSLGQRTWFVGRVPLDLRTGRMRYVGVFWQHGDAKMFRTYRADYVTWNHEEKIWNFYKCKVYEFDEFGTPKISYFWHHTIPDWNETPWHVISSSKKAEFLGVRELTSFLRSNADFPPVKLAPYRTHWHVSWAEPFRCLFIVLMAAPLGIVHSRRGVLGGVAGAITIFFGLIFLDGVFLAVGENGSVPPMIAAWAPNIILGVVGGFLLHLKGKNREMPKINPVALIGYLKSRSANA